MTTVCTQCHVSVSVVYLDQALISLLQQSKIKICFIQAIIICIKDCCLFCFYLINFLLLPPRCFSTLLVNSESREVYIFHIWIINNHSSLASAYVSELFRLKTIWSTFIYCRFQSCFYVRIGKKLPNFGNYFFSFSGSEGTTCMEVLRLEKQMLDKQVRWRHYKICVIKEWMDTKVKGLFGKKK